MSLDNPENFPVDELVIDADNPLHDVKDLAALFKVQANTIRRWIKEGHIKAIQAPGKIVVPHQELMRFARSRYGATDGED